MIDLATGRVTRISAPPLVPMDRPIDLEHLARVTMDDRDIEREVLRLFDLQAGSLLDRLKQADLPDITTLAHTLKGSALGIGANRVAAAARGLERAAAGADDRSVRQAMRDLREAVEEARLTISDLLRGH